MTLVKCLLPKSSPATSLSHWPGGSPALGWYREQHSRFPYSPPGPSAERHPGPWNRSGSSSERDYIPEASAAKVRKEGRCTSENAAATQFSQEKETHGHPPSHCSHGAGAPPGQNPSSRYLAFIYSLQAYSPLSRDLGLTSHPFPTSFTQKEPLPVDNALVIRGGGEKADLKLLSGMFECF